MLIKKLKNNLLLYVVLIILTVIWLYPIVWAIATSLKTDWEILSHPSRIIPQIATCSNYAELFRKDSRAVHMGLAFFNSSLVAFSVTVLALIVCSSAAYAFSRIKFFGKNFFFMLIIASLMIPVETILVPRFLLFHKFGLLDSYVALIFPWVATAFPVFLLRQFMIGIPIELEEAAFIDGASRFKIFTQIILPLVKPALATASIFIFVSVWNDFLWPLVAINKVELMTLPVALMQFRAAFGLRGLGTIMASVVFATILPLVIFALAQDKIIEGISHQGLKG